MKLKPKIMGLGKRILMKMEVEVMEETKMRIIEAEAGEVEEEEGGEEVIIIKEIIIIETTTTNTTEINKLEIPIKIKPINNVMNQPTKILTSLRKIIIFKTTTEVHILKSLTIIKIIGVDFTINLNHKS
jgi:hypothetical protein